MKKLLIILSAIILIAIGVITNDNKVTVNVNQPKTYSEKFMNLIKQMDSDLIELRKAIDNKDVHKIETITDEFLRNAYEIDKDDVSDQSQITQLQIIIRNYEVLYKFAKDNKVNEMENAYISLSNSINELKNML